MWPHRTGESPFLERRLSNHVLLGPEMGQASIVEGPEETRSVDHSGQKTVANLLHWSVQVYETVGLRLRQQRRLFG